MTVVYKDRRNTDCEKWDGLESQFGRDDLLAAWVADMDFEAPVCIKAALQKYVDFNVYGYYAEPEAYKNAFIKWEKNYQQYEICREWVRFIPGVVPAIYWLVQTWAAEGEGVIVMPPVYYPFLNSIKETGRRIVTCPLKESDGRYCFDLELFEEKIITEKAKVFILCNPHNPVGRVWTEEEIRSVLDICKAHGVYVISDEIHQDIIMPGYVKTTAANTGDYDDILVTLTSASKSFNIAGLQNAFAIIPAEDNRATFDEIIKRVHLSEGGTPGYIAVQAAYEDGREWLNEVIEIIADNYRTLKSSLERNLPTARVFPLEGTYLAWIDLGSCAGVKNVEETMLSECRVACDFGEWFGGEEYKNYIRINLATSKENVTEIARRIACCYN